MTKEKEFIACSLKENLVSYPFNRKWGFFSVNKLFSPLTLSDVDNLERTLQCIPRNKSTFSMDKQSRAWFCFVEYTVVINSSGICDEWLRQNLTLGFTKYLYIGDTSVFDTHCSVRNLIWHCQHIPCKSYFIKIWYLLIMCPALWVTQASQRIHSTVTEANQLVSWPKTMLFMFRL